MLTHIEIVVTGKWNYETMPGPTGQQQFQLPLLLATMIKGHKES